ncbi:MAG TPA: glycerophosphodiester phosphodiesterase family protein [Fodinibius sp.]|nr:glycerophosphodiester phosphodiesterase family protein [Fodinibius sp.]
MSERYRLPELYQENQDTPIVIDHRGASAYYPENTMAAFRAAVELGASMIELDILLSSDGVPVVFHDIMLNTHSSGKGKLSGHTLEQLKALDAGSWFDSDFKGIRIPVLEEVLTFAAGNITLNIEIKTEAVSDCCSGGVEEKCLRLVEEYGMSRHVLFSSFDYRAVTHLKKMNPAIPAALLYNRAASGKKKPVDLVRQYRADAFNYSYRQFRKIGNDRLKERGIPHFVYTVDRPEYMRELLDAGVSGIFTNKPDLLKAVSAEWDAEL